MNSNFKMPTILLALLTSSLVACSSSGSNSSPKGSGGVSNSSSSITIDNAGVVPIIGNTPTTSVVYVHNNGTVNMSGISYSAINNTGGGSSFLDHNSTAACSFIPAGKSCPLSFTTPPINSTTAQGSTLITASYSASNGQISTFSQTINYTVVPNNITNGAVFNSGVLLTSSGNPTAYGTVYLYGSGANQMYTVNSLAFNSGGVQIIQGNLSGKQIQSNSVQAVEISATTDLAAHTSLSLSSGLSANLTATSSLANGTQFTSVANVTVAPAASGAILTAGQVPIINSTATNSSGSLYITNAGNATATLLAPSFPTGVTGLNESGACGASLAAGAGCTIYFSLPQSSGSGNISIPYSGGSSSPLVQTITWYNSSNQALLTMSTNPNFVSFYGGGNTSIPISVTLTNIGGYDLTGVTVSTENNTNGGSANPTTISALACQNSSGSATGTTLPVGGLCTYSITLTDTVTENNMNMELSIIGSYTNSLGAQTYQRATNLSYTSLIPSYSWNPSTFNIVPGTSNSTEFSISSLNSNATVTFALAESASGLTINSDQQTSPGSTTSCSFTPQLTSCQITVTANPFSSSTNYGSIPIYATSPTLANLPSLNAVVRQQSIYIVDQNGSTVNWCPIYAADGSIGFCTPIITTNYATFGLNLVVIDDIPYLYQTSISNITNASVSYPIGMIGLDPNSGAFLPGNTYNYSITKNSNAVLTVLKPDVYGMTVAQINGSYYAYITDSIYNQIYICPVYSNGGISSNCIISTGLDQNSSTTLNQPVSIAILTSGVTNYAYILNAQTNGVSICVMQKSGGYIGTCTFTDPQKVTTSALALKNPRAITTGNTNGNTYIYIASTGTNRIDACIINPLNGSFSSCTSPTDTSFSSPTGIAFNSINGTSYLYISNQGNNTISVCKLNADGSSFVECTATNRSSFPLTSPLGLAIY